MRTETVTVIFDRKKTASRLGYGKVDIRIYLSSKERKFFTVGTATLENYETVMADKAIQNKVKSFRKIVAAMEVLGEPMTIANFVSHLEDKDGAIKKDLEERKTRSAKAAARKKNHHDFIAFCREQTEQESLELKPASIRLRKVCINALEQFGGIKTYNDLTAANIMAFDEWLRDGTRKTSTIYDNYHKKLHHFIRVLKMRDEIRKDPYEGLKISRGQYNEREPLNEMELAELRKATLTPKLDRVRDLFVFSAYTGLAYCDVMAFNYQEMTETVGDISYIDGRRLKTGTKFFTPILRPAMDVLRKYDYQLPVISNQKLNDYLKVVQERVGIKTRMTFHVARHSFATLALAHDVPIENVARMLGHKDIKVTQVYAKILPKTIERHAVLLNSSLI